MTKERMMQTNIFPKGELFTTKMPIRVKMVNDQQKARKCRVFFPKDKVQGFEVDVELDLDTNDVSETVKHIMDEIHSAYIIEHSKEFGIVPFELLVEIRSPDVPTLELVDLPGIRENPPEVKQETVQIAEKYMREQHSLILCVMQGSINRINNSQTGGLVETLKKQAQTLIVLTKADTMTHKKAKKHIVPRVTGECQEVSGIYGVISVVNRDSDEEFGHERNPPLENSITSELQWFEEHLPELDRNSQVSCIALISKLDRLIQKHIVETWVPNAKKQMQARLDYAQKQLYYLGNTFGTKADLVAFEKYWATEFDARLKQVINDHISQVGLSANFQRLDLILNSMSPGLPNLDEIRKKKLFEEELYEKYVGGTEILDIAKQIAVQTIEKIFEYKEPKSIFEDYLKDFTNFITSTLKANPTGTGEERPFNLWRFPKYKDKVKSIVEKHIMHTWNHLNVAGRNYTEFMIISVLLQAKPYRASENLKGKLYEWIDKQSHLMAVQELLVPIEGNIFSCISQRELRTLLNEDTAFNNARLALEDQIRRLEGSLAVMTSLGEDIVDYEKRQTKSDKNVRLNVSNQENSSSLQNGAVFYFGGASTGTYCNTHR